MAPSGLGVGKAVNCAVSADLPDAVTEACAMISFMSSLFVHGGVAHGTEAFRGDADVANGRGDGCWTGASPHGLAGAFPLVSLVASEPDEAGASAWSSSIGKMSSCPCIGLVDGEA